MASTQVGYSDAVKLLGGGSPLITALDRALGGLLLAATGGGSELAISLFDAKTEAARLGQQLIIGLRDRIKGYSRYDRTRRLEAAHAIVVVTAFFEGLDDIGLPFDARRLQLTAQERGRITGAGSSVRELLVRGTPTPVPHLDHDAFADTLLDWYATAASGLADFLPGLAIWDELTETERRAARHAVHSLPRVALRRYENQQRSLAAEVPEFGYWTAELRQREIGTALARVETVLASFASVHTPGDVAGTLVRAWRAALDRPILSEGDVPGDLTIPTLAAGYVDPDFRVRPVDAAGSPAEEAWWALAPTRSDLAEFLASHLTTPDATRAPLLVLGQPGAGKSVLTRILAARLDARDFLPVRVALREVPAEAEIQDQIEYAVRTATGETLSWPALVRAAGPALPVVLLDGFDELLQATGVNHSDYLGRVAAFQRREADLGRPVAVLVTSRTAVADRARPPAGALSIRLEPFRAAHVRHWVEIWNAANTAALHGRGLATLDAGVVLRQPGLAGQPLLLMMLALYDADTNALRAAGETLDESSLYERLLTTFARREVTKTRATATDAQLTALVEAELLRLSVAAFGMFNRNRQWVTEQELDADLHALMPDRRPEPPGDFRQRLGPAQKLVGRFFFMQRGQATRDGERLRTYEFLHATFGEYLIARLTVRLIEELAAEEEAASASVFGPAGCRDGRLHALLSFAPLTSREPILEFLAERAKNCSPGARRLPVTLFRRLDDRATDQDVRDYLPATPPAPERHAAYDLNLVLLAVVLNGGVRASELFPDSSDAALAWRRHALLWQAMLSTVAWWALVFTLQTRGTWRDGRRDLLVVLDRDTAPPPVDPYWLYRAHPGDPRRAVLAWQDTRADGLSRQCNLVRDRVNETLMHAAEPMMERIADAATTFVARDAERSYSIAAAIGRLQLAVLLSEDAAEIRRAADDAVHAVTLCWPPNAEESVRRRGARIVLVLVGLVRTRMPSDVHGRWSEQLHNAL
ncbi:NACHT domain-containing protein [Catenuloplanes atrovinosus]|uniref:NACHT N-terminal Helical domain-containing protein n=1 Tax=Catenuloplanes atrovinosus TaxID=137266 RepID=A0AAE3YL17_9ACTN|nr:hypothetical protein [Catenuloplanes atrovinosus]MDR7275420.1 hypothetical protein [Catenuloplanes atrovinosus]